MNSQYLQWITGNRRGEIESVELLQNGQTSQDVAVLSNGNKVPMNNVGKDFIILPSTDAALSTFDMNMMYPIEREQKRSNKEVKREHQKMLGMEVEPQKAEKKPVKSSFSSDLLSRSKKSQTNFKVDFVINVPSKEFFEMINKTFDDATINEVVDLIVASVNNEDIRNSIKTSITNFYGVNK